MTVTDLRLNRRYWEMRMIGPWPPWAEEGQGARGARWGSGPASLVSRQLGYLHLSRSLELRIGPAGELEGLPRAQGG